MCRGAFFQIVVATLALATVVACGNDRDRPQDCRSDEFYNESTQRCSPCPAVSPPDCPEGCGWEVYERDNGCTASRCEENCRFCREGQRLNEETGLCERCPGAPDCDAMACDGGLRVEGSYAGPCPAPEAFACGDCSHPRDGCAVGDQDQCIDE